jgi:iron complex transport system substrate-binding protein
MSGIKAFSALAMMLMLSLAHPGTAAGARTFTDSAGRTVEIPGQVDTVYAAGPPAMVLVYVLKPEALTGWPRAPHPEEMPYIAEPYRGLPETGRLTGRGGEANLEVVLDIDPDLIIDFGSVTETYRSLADRVQEQTGIPYVLIDGRFENTAAALRRVGELLGVPARGRRLAGYVEETLADLDAALAAVPEEARPRTYLARGPAGLETGLKGSINTEIIERAGGRNVADPGDGRSGIVEASIEQVIVADPDTIITWDRNFYDTVWNDPLWQEITAVRRGRVFLSPTAPFGWIDRPPSINRIIGLKWLSALFYPDRIELDLRRTTREFYRLFYHVDLSEDQLDDLIQWANGRAPQ